MIQAIQVLRFHLLELEKVSRTKPVNPRSIRSSSPRQIYYALNGYLCTRALCIDNPLKPKGILFARVYIFVYVYVFIFVYVLPI